MGQLTTRHERWAENLADEIAAAMGRQFKWGSFDCCLFAVDCVKAMTGVDVGAEYRGYDDRISAYAALRRVAGGGVERAATRELGSALSNPLLVQRGDVVMIDTELGHALGICTGSAVAFAADFGLSFVSVDRALMAWAVGRTA